MLTNRVHKPYYCKSCGSASGIKICKCQTAYYCSKNCQKIDWKMHKSDCYKVMGPRSSNIFSIHNSANNKSTNHQCEHVFPDSDIPSQSSVHLDRERRQYDPTPLQYNQPQPISTNTHHNVPSTTITPVEDFEVNLFNSFMYSVDERTEKEILKNLNIRAEELLNSTSYNLDTHNSSSLDIANLKEYQPSTGVANQSFDEKVFEQIQRQNSFEFRPETQRLLKETKDNLEKELLLIREHNLLEPQKLGGNESVESEISTMHMVSNPKYINHAKVDENLVYNALDDQIGLEEMCCNLVRDMNEYGVCVLDNFIGQERGLKVLQEVKQMHSSRMFKDGQLVAAKGRTDTNKHIRGDKIAWVDAQETGVPNIKFLMNQVDAVVTLANRMNNNGKLGQYKIRERTKAMVACYEGKGSHYVKHVDNPNRDGRCITCIYYLNLDWDVRESGGLLRIFPEGWVDRVADVEPIFDRIVFFWSDRRNPHEVQPSHHTRYAITIWYFDAIEREMAVRKYQRESETVRKAA